MKLSKNFTLEEFTKSDTAKLFDIKNYPNDEQIKNLQALAVNVLQPISDFFNVSIFINSGYRSKELNAKTGGSNTSHHCCNSGFAAADIHVHEVKMSSIFKYIQNNLSFCQLIWEKGNDIAPDWIHVSYDRNGGNKKEVLKFDGKTYKKFKI